MKLPAAGLLGVSLNLALPVKKLAAAELREIRPQPMAAISHFTGVNCNTDAQKMGRNSPFWRKLPGCHSDSLGLLTQNTYQNL